MNASAVPAAVAALERRVAELEAAADEHDELSCTITHDLRAPLRAISGYARLIAEEEGGKLSGEGQRWLEAVEAGASRMTQLVDGLARYSRLARADFACAPVDMYRLASDAADALERSGTAGRAAIDVAPLPPVMGDAARLREVWDELLANAVKFSATAEMPLVRVAIKKGGSGPIFTVEDNGAGFDMRHAGRLFGMFQRLHHPADFDGIGVGLAVARRIVHRHGGSIRAEANPGAGARFSFEIPARSGGATQERP